MQKLVSGSVIEVYIENIRCYVYAKYIDVREFVEDASYPFQFRIHRDFCPVPLKSIDGLDFSNLLISPLHLTGFKELIKAGEWKIVGKQDITKYDKQQHCYKKAWPPNLLALFENVKQWYVLEDVNDINHGKVVPYYRCAHLEYAENLGAEHLSFRIIIEYYKANGQKVNFDKSKWNKFDYVLYSRYINMPLYLEVPDEFKGKLLPEN